MGVLDLLLVVQAHSPSVQFLYLQNERQASTCVPGLVGSEEEASSCEARRVPNRAKSRAVGPYHRTRPISLPIALSPKVTWSIPGRTEP